MHRIGTFRGGAVVWATARCLYPSTAPFRIGPRPENEAFGAGSWGISKKHVYPMPNAIKSVDRHGAALCTAAWKGVQHRNPATSQSVQSNGWATTQAHAVRQPRRARCPWMHLYELLLTACFWPRLLNRPHLSISRSAPSHTPSGHQPGRTRGGTTSSLWAAFGNRVRQGLAY